MPPEIIHVRMGESLYAAVMAAAERDGIRGAQYVREAALTRVVLHDVMMRSSHPRDWALIDRRVRELRGK